MWGTLWAPSHLAVTVCPHIRNILKMSKPTARKGLLLKADPIAATFRDEVKDSLAKCTTRPRLVGILATSSSPSKYYAEFTRKQCEELGVEFTLKLIGAALSPELGEGEGVEEAIIEANEDESIHGIMVRSSTLSSSFIFSKTISCF